MADMKHYDELSIKSGIEFKYASTERIYDAFVRFYGRGKNASVFCLGMHELEDASLIASIVPDESVEVVITRDMYCF